MEEPLDEVALRVLGSLIEKQYATPDNYPLTLNALRAACNQTSARDPVMRLGEDEVLRALEALARRSFARGVMRGDSRAMRYRQELGEALHLHQNELAALCVLMLRGPQTPGEIRTRAARLFEFIDPSHVEITLGSLMDLPSPLVMRFPLRPGQKEARYAHLLAGEPPEGTRGEADGAEGNPSSFREKSNSVREPSGAAARIDALEQEVESLRGEVAELRGRLESFIEQFQ